jgi:hypothetical protein
MRSSEQVYGRYLIRTLTSGTGVSARAFAGGRAVMTAKDKTMDATLSAIRKLLDDRDASERAARQDGIPTAQEFVDAFARLNEKIGKHHWDMLRALLAAPDCTLTVAQIAAAAGYPSFRTANEKFGTLARMVAEDLGYNPERRSDGSPMWMLILATDANPTPRDIDGDWRWTMRKQVADCLVAMNLGRPAA